MPDVQISSTTLPALPSAAPRGRDGAVDSAQPTTVKPVAGRGGESSAQGEVTRIRTRASAAARSAAADESSLQNLPPRSRNAVQSYLSNGPSIEERLGVELAGVDVFA